MAKSRKVIITCAVTGSIHTPSMSPHLPVTAAGDRRCRHRRGRGGRRHRPSARAQPAGRTSRPDAGGLRALPQGDQAALQRGGEHHHRRRAHHDGRGARQAGRDLQAGSRLAQHGHDEFRALPDDPALQGQVQIRLGGAVSGRLAQGHVQEHLRRHRIHPHHLRREQHPLRDRVLRHRPSLHAAALPRPRRGQAAAVRAVGVRHSRRHRRASGRRHHDEAHRRPPARRQLSLVGARRRRQPDAGRGHGGGDGRQCARRHGGLAVDRRRQVGRVERAAGHQRAQDSRRARPGDRVRPTRRARSSRSRAATR